MSDIKISSNRSFGIVFFTVFLIISLWPLIYSNEIRSWSLIISLIFLVLGILNSHLLSPLNKFWNKFGLLLGNVISPIVMGVIFFLIVMFFRKIGNTLISYNSPISIFASNVFFR